MIRPRAVKGGGGGGGNINAGGSTASSPSTNFQGFGSSSSRPGRRKPQRRSINTSMYVLFIITIGAGLVVIGMVTVFVQINQNVDNNGNIKKNARFGKNTQEILTKKAEKAQEYATDSTSSIREVRQQFQERYGNYATSLLERGLEKFGSLDATALRILEAQSQQRPFVFGFSGYSVTVGRGNYFNQSFPFVVERILRRPFKDVFDLDLVVRNGAIGGIPSFPYAFCLEHFLGQDVDVLGWDYSMNEGGKDSSVLESFIRQSLQQLPKKPMLIMLDRNVPRSQLLGKYTSTTYSTSGVHDGDSKENSESGDTSLINNHFLLQDALAVRNKETVEATVFESKELPVGFQEWDTFGAPAKCPGRGSWHPKKQEHAMIGWMISMYFVEAMERALELQHDHNLDGDEILSKARLRQRQIETTSIPFPKPFSSKTPSNSKEVTELLYGHEQATNGDGSEGEKQYVMKDVSCRTSFLPATDHSKVLQSIIVDGLAFSESELDIMVERTDAHYNKGWVFDVSKVERDTKRKVESCGGLGYVDMKIAVYGTPDSGRLSLWLPHEAQSHHDKNHDDHDHTDIADAKHWFDDIIICEANEKRKDNACHLDQDLEIVVGGIATSKVEPVKGAGEYLKRTTCVSVEIPPSARITKFGSLPEGYKTQSSHFAADDGDEAVGLRVDITVKNDAVKRENGACCLSHIVWENH